MQSSLKIIHIYPPKQVINGGIESQIRDICLCLEEQGHEAEWWGEAEFLSKLKKCQMLRENAYFIFHGVLPRTVLALFYSVIRYRIAKRLLWMPHFHPPEFTKRPTAVRIYMMAVALLFSAVRHLPIVVYSDSQKQAFGRYIKSKNMDVLPFGLRANNYGDGQKVAARRQATKLVYDCIYICRSDVIKRQDLYLFLAKSFPDKKFCLITDRELNAPKNVDCHYSVSHEKLVDLLLSSRFFVSTSDYESYGLAIAEAEFHGLPALARRQTGYFDQFKTNHMPDTDIGLCFHNDEEAHRLLSELMCYSDKKLLAKEVIFYFQNRSQKASFENTMTILLQKLTS